MHGLPNLKIENIGTGGKVLLRRPSLHSQSVKKYIRYYSQKGTIKTLKSIEFFFLKI